jgi:hypothetical protein
MADKIIAACGGTVAGSAPAGVRLGGVLRCLG